MSGPKLLLPYMPSWHELGRHYISLQVRIRQVSKQNPLVQLLWSTEEKHVYDTCL